MSKETQDKSDIIEAYGRFVPEQFLSLLGKDSIMDVALGDHVERTMTILFSDIRRFTPLSESMTPRENFDFINSYLSAMEPVVCHYGGVIDKYIGDAIMALFPHGGADAALQGSIAMLLALREFNRERERRGGVPIRIGIGLNTGVVMLGTIGGPHRMDGTVISDAVNLAAHMEALTKVYGTPLLISENTCYTLADQNNYHVRFIDRVRAKGKDQPESVYEVYDADSEDVLQCKDRLRGTFEEGVAHYHLRNIGEAKRFLTKCVDACQRDTAAQVYLDRCNRFEETGVHEGTGEVDLHLQWNTSLAIGNPMIDNQHKSLFRCAADFVETMKRTDCESETSTASRSLSQAVTEHFRDEEDSMEQAGYLFLDQQKQQHARFLRYFTELKRDIERDLNHKRLFLLFRMQILIVDWLINHTGGMDRHFGKHLAGRTHGGSPRKV